MIIHNKIIKENSPTFIIAEACDNHLGNIETAKKMIIESKIAGVDAIKFQHHLPDEEMLPNIPMSDNFQEPLYEFLKKYALSLDQHKKLMDFCDSMKIIYLCTPFSYKAAEELYSIGYRNPFKIGSGEMTDYPSLRKIALLGNSMILSTGMCTKDEIQETYRVMKTTDVPFAFMNCTSEYPPVYKDIPLNFISYMKENYKDIIIGHSDHTPDLYTCFAAVTLGAKIIEKHIILDKNQQGPDKSVSIDMKDLTNLVDGIRKIEEALYAKKEIKEKEKCIRQWAFRSVVSIKNIKKGEIITQDMIWSKRPGTGIPSKLMNEVIGKMAKENILANNLIRWDQIA